MVIHGTITPMDAKTARTLNIREWVAQRGGPAAFSRAVAEGRWSQAQVSQWISESAPKGIGHALARELEHALGLAPGTMDKHDGAAPTWSHVARPDAEKIAVTARAINRILDRRHKGLTLDITELLDAELFAEAYAECVAMPDASEADMVAVVADLMMAREAKARGKESKQAGRVDRGEGRKVGAG